MTEDDILRTVAEPDCPLSYEELWDLLLAPRGRPLLDIIRELEASSISEGKSESNGGTQPAE